MATLKEHEILCEQRYKSVESRLGKLEVKLDEIHKNIEDFKTYLLGLALKSALAIFVVVCGAVFVIKL
jgi:hypothetical protein